MASSSSSKKSMDVSKPGNTPADASAKPIIVSHRPIVQDPMVKSETEVSDLQPAETPQSVKSSPTSGEKVIKPLEHAEEADGKVEKSTDEAAPEATDDKETSSPPEEPEPEKADTEEKPAKADESPKAATHDKEAEPKSDTKKSSQSSDANVVDAVLDQGDADKRKEEQKAEQEIAKLEHIQKLIDEKKYFVKTGQVARRRNNRIAIGLLLLIVVTVGLYLAVDAGAIKPGFDVPIHVIHT